MKKFLSAILGMVLLLSSISVSAASYTAQDATFPVIVNGSLYNGRVVVIDGTTYLPLKDIGTVLGTKVQWNPILQQS